MAWPAADGRPTRLPAAATARTVLEHGEPPAAPASGRVASGPGVGRAAAAAYCRLGDHLQRYRIPYYLPGRHAGTAAEGLTAPRIEIQILTDRGQVRSVCGIVNETRAGDFDGGVAVYHLVVRDALAIMEKAHQQLRVA